MGGCRRYCNSWRPPKQSHPINLHRSLLPQHLLLRPPAPPCDVEPPPELAGNVHITSHLGPPRPNTCNGRLVCLDTLLSLAEALQRTKRHLKMEYLRLVLRQERNLFSVMGKVAVCGSGASVYTYWPGRCRTTRYWTSCTRARPSSWRTTPTRRGASSSGPRARSRGCARGG